MEQYCCSQKNWFFPVVVPGSGCTGKKAQVHRPTPRPRIFMARTIFMTRRNDGTRDRDYEKSNAGF
jgi:hypothetical protein